MSAAKLVKTLLEEPDARDLGGKGHVHQLMRDAVLSVLPAGSTATSQRGVHTFHAQDYGKIRIQSRWVVATPKPNTSYFFGGDVAEALANVVVLVRHQDEVAQVADKLKRQLAAKVVGE
jgi:hypothetical protein